MALADVGGDAFWVFVDDVVVVVDVRVIGLLCAATICDGGDGGDVSHGPGDFIDGVDALFNEGSGAEPLEVHPVPQLPLDIGHAFWLATGEGFDGVCHVGAVDGADFAEFSGEDFAVGFTGAGVEAPAEAVLDGEVLLFGDLGGFEDRFESGNVDCHGFFDEGVLPGVDGGAEVLGAEAGRGCEDDEVDSGVDDLLIGIESYEAALRGAFDLFCEGLDGFHASFDTFSECVTDGPEDGVWISAEGLVDGAISTTATADEADFDLVGDVLRFGDVGKAGGERGCGAGLENVASVERIHIKKKSGCFVR